MGLTSDIENSGKLIKMCDLLSVRIYSYRNKAWLLYIRTQKKKKQIIYKLPRRQLTRFFSDNISSSSKGLTFNKVFDTSCKNANP